MKIRPATKADMMPLLDLIHSLAKFDHRESGMTFSDLQKYIFCENPYAEIVVVEDEGLLVGYALYYYSFSAFKAKPALFIDDLFIHESYRGHGVGHKLLSAVAKIARENDCCRVEWYCLSWNQLAIDMYEGLGAVALRQLIPFRLADKVLEEF